MIPSHGIMGGLVVNHTVVMAATVISAARKRDTPWFEMVMMKKRASKVVRPLAHVLD